MGYSVAQMYTASNNWLTHADIDGTITVTINEVGHTTWDRKDDKSGREYKVDEIVLGFEGYDKKLSLRKINAARVAKQLGDNTDYWIGQQITLYVEDDIQTPSGLKPGIRVLPQAPVMKKTRPQGPGPAPHVATQGIVRRQQRQAPPPPVEQYEGPDEEEVPF
jgi:hypothetical protein